jgi:PTS system nitrogen regulatory IIA component
LLAKPQKTNGMKMPNKDLITIDSVISNMRVANKKQALLELSERAAQLSGLDAREIFDALLQRERLGSTGVGNGIAIPHSKLAKAQTLFGVFARLDKPINYDSLDGQPVDLIFLLIAPDSAGADHLTALSRVARSLREPSLVAKLRATQDASAIYSLLVQPPKSHAA